MEYYDPCTGVREEDPLRIPTNARARLRAARRKEGEQKYYDTYASRVAGSLIPPHTQGKHIVTSFGNLGELAGDRSAAPNQYQMHQSGRSGIRISGSGDRPSLPISPDVLRTIETTTLNGHKVNHCGQVMDAHWPAVDRIIHGDFYHVKGKAIGESLSSKPKDSQWNENSNIKEGKRMRFRNYEMDPVASNRPFVTEHPPQRVYNTSAPEPAGKVQQSDHPGHFVGSGMAHADWSTSADVPRTTIDDYLGDNVDDQELDSVMGVGSSPADHDHFGHRNVDTGIRHTPHPASHLHAETSLEDLPPSHYKNMYVRKNGPETVLASAATKQRAHARIRQLRNTQQSAHSPYCHPPQLGRPKSTAAYMNSTKSSIGKKSGYLPASAASHQHNQSQSSGQFVQLPSNVAVITEAELRGIRSSTAPQAPAPKHMVKQILY